VELIAVSKKMSLDKIREAFDSGQRAFGENYVQELVPKLEQLENAKLNWHFIGPLQSNKVRKVIGRVVLIHSVDRESLLLEISKQAVAHNLVQNILIQLNVADEDGKSGASRQDLGALIDKALQLEGIRVCGLMAMPPFVEDGEANREHFRKIKNIFDDLKAKFPDTKREAFSELSMGTSQDFEVAIEEGATMVRVGTQIFGQRV